MIATTSHEELGVARVDLVDHAALVGDGRELGRARQGHLDRAGTVPRQERQLVRRQPPELPQLRRHDPGHAAHAARAWAADLPHAGHGVAEVEALDTASAEVAHEVRRRSSPSVKISNPSSLLPGQDFEDRPVLQLAQALGAGRRVVARLEELGRAEKAADLIGAVWGGHRGTSWRRAENGVARSARVVTASRAPGAPTSGGNGPPGFRAGIVVDPPSQRRAGVTGAGRRCPVLPAGPVDRCYAGVLTGASPARECQTPAGPTCQAVEPLRRRRSRVPRPSARRGEPCQAGAHRA